MIRYSTSFCYSIALCLTEKESAAGFDSRRCHPQQRIPISDSWFGCWSLWLAMTIALRFYRCWSQARKCWCRQAPLCYSRCLSYHRYCCYFDLCHWVPCTLSHSLACDSAASDSSELSDPDQTSLWEAKLELRWWPCERNYTSISIGWWGPRCLTCDGSWSHQLWWIFERECLPFATLLATGMSLLP